MFRKTLLKLINNEALSKDDIQNFVIHTAENKIPTTTIAAITLGLTKKGLDKNELASLAESIRAFSKIKIDDPNAVACAGTGAQDYQTFNITTASALVAAASGAKIIKKANYGILKKTGNANFIEELGLSICNTNNEAQQQLLEKNIALINSVEFNNAEKVLLQIRKDLDINTIFNITDALIQPLGVEKILLGTAYPDLAEIIIEVLKETGYKHAMVVNAQNPLMDEISICSETTVYELKDGEIEKYEITPDAFGIKRADILSLRGATPKYNASIAMDIFNGKIKDSKLDVIAMNAGAMIYLSGIARNYLEGIMKAYTTISKGLVLDNIKNTAE